MTEPTLTTDACNAAMDAAYPSMDWYRHDRLGPGRRAAAILMAEVRRLRRAKDTAMLEFGAATYLFKGGDYSGAYRMARRIDPRFLCARFRPCLAPFVTELRARAAGRPYRSETVTLFF